MPEARKATLYRMVLPDHVCPFGLRAKALLEQAGYDLDDRLLESREQVDAFKLEHNISTTPLIFIEEECIGGCDALEARLADA